MRKCRGLTKEGKWVYGWYFKGDVDWILQWDKTKPIGDRLILIEVIPGTVGQFTGLYDKTKWEDATPEQRRGYTRETWNGVEIYEGDILKYDRSNMLAVVEYCVDKFAMKVITPKGVRWYSMTQKYEFIEKDLVLDEHEIIGNRHQNPSLLEKQ